MEVAILGHFGGKKIYNDGQTVKTLAIHDALVRYGIKVTKVDSYYVKRNPILFIWLFLKLLLECKIIIVLLSSNGRRVFFPILYFLVKFFGKRVFH